MAEESYTWAEKVIIWLNDKKALSIEERASETALEKLNKIRKEFQEVSDKLVKEKEQLYMEKEKLEKE